MRLITKNFTFTFDDLKGYEVKIEIKVDQSQRYLTVIHAHKILAQNMMFNDKTLYDETKIFPIEIAESILFVNHHFVK